MHGNKSALSVTHIVHVTAACKKTKQSTSMFVVDRFTVHVYIHI